VAVARTFEALDRLLPHPTVTITSARGSVPLVAHRARKSNLLFLPDLHSLNLLEGQLVPRSIINPGRRRTCMGDPLRDLGCAARIHVLGNARRTEAGLSSKWTENRGKPERYGERNTYVLRL
jgi:hypothetical protein